MSKTPKKPTLKYLLEWVEIQNIIVYRYSKRRWFASDGWEAFQGDSIYNALCKAHKIWKDKK